MNKFMQAFIFSISAWVISLGGSYFLLTSLTACTYSVTNVHTQGKASDVVDEEEEASAHIAPTVSIPAI